MKPLKLDAQTRDYLTRWNKWEVPTAKITDGKVPGQGVYTSLPLLGWFEHQETPIGKMAVCSLSLNIMIPKSHKMVGVMTLAMPVTKNTELHVNTLLCYLGWDGRVWPNDDTDKWPSHSVEDVDLVKYLLAKTGLGSTLTFPPQEEGHRALQLPIYKIHSAYQVAPWHPLPPEDDSPAKTLGRFRELAQDPTLFKVAE